MTTTRSAKRRAARAAIRGVVERGSNGRPFLGVHFSCCGVYSRIYRTRDRTAYEGRCPHCLGRIRVRIGSTGVTNRFFRAV